ncbi:UNVERIFIED_CONTAM: hypothetical protein GTU68_062858 [Idotea baltica]|nr:hypothetical protein [Idotea baltica]
MVAIGSVDDVKRILDQLKDPEIPVLSLGDLGIIRSVTSVDDDLYKIVITPTYVGCPAMRMIDADIRALLEDYDVPYQLEHQISPSWSTTWMSQAGRDKLKKYGIAPPKEGSTIVTCPLCDSDQTHLVSEVGSTPCKSHFTCLICKEPFDHFKCH